MDQATATAFSERALEEIRSGRRDPTLRTIVAGEGLNRRDSAGQDAPEFSWQLRTVRLAADLLDRWGDYDGSANCIQRAESLQEPTLKFPPIRGLTGEKRDAWFERLWCTLQVGTSLHRRGNYELALTLPRAVLASLRNVAADERDELSIRANYMLGRIMQSTGAAAESEEYFREAIRGCSVWMADLPNIADYARYQSAIALSGLARSTIQMGHLKRALGQLHIAKTMLRDGRDPLTLAYVNFLIGSVYRQTNRVDEAIRFLADARSVFLSEKHSRLYGRCSLELAHAYLNNNQPSMVQTTFAEWNAAAKQATGHQSSARRSARGWAALRLLLDARSHLAQDGHTPDAEHSAVGALEILNDLANPEFQSHVVVAKAIQADCRLRCKDYDSAIAIVGEALKDGPPADRADHVWLLLVRAKAYLDRGRPADRTASQADIFQCRQLGVENVYLRQRLAEIVGTRQFTVQTTQASLNYDDIDRDLRQFLIAAAEARGAETNQEIGKILGRKHTTIARWRKGLD